MGGETGRAGWRRTTPSGVNTRGSCHGAACEHTHSQQSLLGILCVAYADDGRDEVEDAIGREERDGPDGELPGGPQSTQR